MENSLLFGPFIVDAPAKVGIICAALLVLLIVGNSACKEPELFWGGAVGFLIFCALSVVAGFMTEMEIRNGYMLGSAVFFFFGVISAVISWLLKRRKPEREIEAAIPQEEKSKTDDILTELR